MNSAGLYSLLKGAHITEKKIAEVKDMPEGDLRDGVLDYLEAILRYGKKNIDLDPDEKIVALLPDKQIHLKIS